MVIYSTAEIAVLCGKAERTIQLWLQQGKLPARRIKANLWEISETDLEPFIPKTLQESFQDQIDALSARISELERFRDERLSDIGTSPEGHSRRDARVKPGIVASGGSLPDGLVSLSAFAAGHNIAQTTSRKAAEDGRLPVTRGRWKQGKVWIETALNAEQQRRFVELFASNPGFKPCERCPHET